MSYIEDEDDEDEIEEHVQWVSRFAGDILLAIAPVEFSTCLLDKVDHAFKMAEHFSTRLEQVRASKAREVANRRASTDGI